MNLPKAAFAFFLVFLALICVPAARGQTVNCNVTPPPPECPVVQQALSAAQQVWAIYVRSELIEARAKMLEARLEKCGNCADRAKIQAELEQAVKERAEKRAVENQAFSAFGFGAVGVHNFNDLKEYIARGLDRYSANSVDAEFRRHVNFVKDAISLHCSTLYNYSSRIYTLSDAERQKALQEFDRKAAQEWKWKFSQCQQEVDSFKLTMYQELMLKSCSVKHGFWGQGEKTEAFSACMNANDPITQVCTQDLLMRWEIGQRKVLHRELPPPTCDPYKPDPSTLRAYREFGMNAGTATPPSPSSRGKGNAARPSASSPPPPPNPAPIAPPAASPAPSASVQPAAAQVIAAQSTPSASLFMPGSDPYALSPRQLSILARPATGPIVRAGTRVIVRTSEPIDLTNTDAKRRFRAQTEMPIEIGRDTYTPGVLPGGSAGFRYAPKGADVFLKTVGAPLPGVPPNYWEAKITVDYVIVNDKRIFVPTTEVVKLLKLVNGRVVPGAPDSLLGPQSALSFSVTNAIPEGEIEAAAQP